MGATSNNSGAFLFDDQAPAADLKGANTTDMYGNFSNVTTAPPRHRMYNYYHDEQLIFLCVLLLAIIIGNVLVLLAIGFSKRGQRSRMNFFIMHLAMADLSVGLISVTTDIVWKITVQWYAGNVMCKIVRYFQSVVMYASTYVLVALSIDRFDAIARPLSFSGSGLRAKILVGSAWAGSFFFSVPMLFINRESIMEDHTIQCWIKFGERWHWQMYITLIAIVLFIVPAIIIAICYAVIIVVIWTKSKVLDPVQKKPHKRFTSTKSNGSSCDGKANGYKKDSGKSSSRGIIPQAKIRTVKMTLVIVIVFIMCWSPYFVFNLLHVYRYLPKGQRTVAISILFQSLGPLNSVANPIIYGIFSTRICRNLRRVPMLNRVLSAVCCCLCPADRQQDRNTHSVYSSTGMASYTTVGTGSGRTTRMRDAARGLSGPVYAKTGPREKETEILMKNLVEEHAHSREDFRDVENT